MKRKWGGEDAAGEFPRDRAAWTVGAFCDALLSVFAIAGYCYMRAWTPLQRHYLTTYIGTPLAGAFRTDGWYTLVRVVTRMWTRLALGPEPDPSVTPAAERPRTPD